MLLKCQRFCRYSFIGYLGSPQMVTFAGIFVRIGRAGSVSSLLIRINRQSRKVEQRNDNKFT